MGTKHSFSELKPFPKLLSDKSAGGGTAGTQRNSFAQCPVSVCEVYNCIWAESSIWEYCLKIFSFNEMGGNWLLEESLIGIIGMDTRANLVWCF